MTTTTNAPPANRYSVWSLVRAAFGAHEGSPLDLYPHCSFAPYLAAWLRDAMSRGLPRATTA